MRRDIPDRKGYVMIHIIIRVVALLFLGVCLLFWAGMGFLGTMMALTAENLKSTGYVSLLVTVLGLIAIFYGMWLVVSTPL
jgi:hypothetical protein